MASAVLYLEKCGDYMPCNSTGGGGGGGSAMAVTTQPVVYTQLTQSQLDDMYVAQNLTPAQQKSCEKYVQSQKEPGTLYSLSQNMNYALVNDLPMTAAQKKTDQNLSDAMHDLGGNHTLTRYDHQGQVDKLLANAGLTQGYHNYSLEQIRDALV